MAHSKGAVTYKPISVMKDAVPARFMHVAFAVLGAAFVMLGFGSKALLNWANDLPINQASDYILYWAQTWQDWMEKAGIASLSDAIHNALTHLQSLRW